MKKALMIVCILIFVNNLTMTSQTKEGRFMVGLSSAMDIAGSSPNLLSIGYHKTYYKTDESDATELSRSSTFGLSPKIGYFVVDHFAVGLDLVYDYTNATQKTILDSETDSRSTTMLGGPFLRFYVPSGAFIPFFELSAGVGSSRTRYKSGGSWHNDDKLNLSSVGGGAGLAFPVGARASIDLMLDYNSVKTSFPDEDNNPRYIEGSLSFNIGFTLFLGAK